jgi:hypothetical protein
MFGSHDNYQNQISSIIVNCKDKLIQKLIIFSEENLNKYVLIFFSVK